MTIREHFEESALSRGLVVRRVFGDEAEAEGLKAGDYLFHETRVAWDWFQSAWEASRASMVEPGAIGAVSRENIRPAKSEEEKERQVAIKEMMETVCKGAPWTLSADAAAKLYDAGYRKIVASKYSDLL